MEIRVSELGEALVVAPVGRLDTTGVSAIEARFTAAIVPKAKPTVVDLSETPFLASLGIRMLISTARALGAKGGKLVLCAASPAVREVLEMTALTELIPYGETQAAALALAQS